MKLMGYYPPNGRASRRTNSERNRIHKNRFRTLRLESLEDRRVLSLTVSTAQLFTTLAAADGDGDNNILTVVGDLTIKNGGSINANDLAAPAAASAAPPIVINVSGDTIFESDTLGGLDTGIFAENRVGGGSGGNISLTVGGNLTMQDRTTVSSSKIAGAGDTGNAGNISIIVAGDVDLQTGSIVKADATGSAGSILVTGQNLNLDGLVSSTSTLSGNANQKPGGGTITLNAKEVLNVSDTGIIRSKGNDPGADLVHLEGCEVIIYGLVESTGAGHSVPNNPPNHLDGTNRPDKDKNSTAGVEIWAGDSLLIDNTGPHNGQINADLTVGANGRSWIDLFAVGDITIVGDTSGPFAVHATNGGNNPTGGTITIKSIGAMVTASGRAIDASSGGSGQFDGGHIVVEALQNINLDTASLLARGDDTPTVGNGGTISVRSASGLLSWKNGLGDVRPTGIGPQMSVSGVITLQAAGVVDVTATSFPFKPPNSNVSPITPTIMANTPSSAPIVLNYVVFPDCEVDPGCPICSGETFMFTSDVTFDFNPVAKGLTPIIVSSDAQLLADLQAVTTFVYSINTPASNWFVQIDTVHDAIQIKDGITVKTAPYFGPSGKVSNNMLTPGITFKTTCDFIVDQGGKVIVQSVNQQAGDIIVEAWGDITINGKLLNEVTGTNGKPGEIDLLNLCGDIRVGPTGIVEVIGVDPGGGRINIVSGEILSECGCNKGIGGDIIIEGLVQAHGKSKSDATMPTVNVVAFDGKIVIDGNNQFGIPAGSKTVTTSGVHVFNRANPHGGVINIQAAQNVEVIGNRILDKANPNRGAISGNRVATNGQGNAGKLEIVSVFKDVVLTDRAIDFENRFNQKSIVTLLAGKNINISVTALINDGAADNSKIVVNARGGTGGTGGTICMHAGQNITVGANAQVLATAPGGTNGKVLLTADGVFTNNGTVSPITGPCLEIIDAIFDDLDDVLFG